VEAGFIYPILLDISCVKNIYIESKTEELHKAGIFIEHIMLKYD